MISIEGILSTECVNSRLCRVETLSSSLKTKPSYSSLKRFSSTLLNKTALGKSIVKNEEQCIKSCLISLTCFSINIITNSTSIPAVMECQLLTQQAYTNKVDLVHQVNSTHLTVLNLGCEKNLCAGNATCTPNYVDDSSSCVCPSSIFTGTYCETETKVSSVWYSRATDATDNMNIVTSDPNFKHVIQRSNCLPNFIYSAQEGIRAHVFAYFMVPDTGLFYFQLYCSSDCRLYISTYRKQDRRVILWGPGTKSKDVYMVKEQKIAIEIVAGCPPGTTNSYTLGVTLPNGTIYASIPDSFLVSFFSNQILK